MLSSSLATQWPKWVLATSNAGKLREFRALLEPLALTVSSQAEHGVAPAEEPYLTFVENALAKARHAAAATSLPAIADDSGLCCEALGGAPGVRSARFAGEQATDAENNVALLRTLEGQSSRRAHYTCVLVALRHATDPEPIIAQAQWAGEILLTARGQGGFGYDPYFWLPSLGQSAAELSAERKNQLSHRGRAMQELLARLIGVWGQ